MQDSPCQNNVVPIFIQKEDDYKDKFWRHHELKSTVKIWLQERLDDGDEVLRNGDGKHDAFSNQQCACTDDASTQGRWDNNGEHQP